MDTPLRQKTDWEQARLAALCRYDLLDTPPEQEFDDLAWLAAQTCGTPIALVSLVDGRRAWFKARVGLELSQIPRDVAFCRYALASPTLLLVPDARADARFADNPLVTGAPGLRFYAGAPLVTPDGHILGTLSVLDYETRTLSEIQQRALRALARQVATLMESRRLQADLERAKGERFRSEAQSRLLFESNPNPMWVLEYETRKILAVNDAAVAQYGYTRPEFLQLTIEDLHAPENLSASYAVLPTLPPCTSRSGQFRHCRKDESLLWADMSGHPMRFGDRDCCMVTARDITDQQRAEEKYRSIFENAIEGIFQTVPDGGFVNVNPALARMLGYDSPEEVLTAVSDVGTQVYAVPEERAELLHRIKVLGAVSGFELQVRRRDGSTFWASLSVRVVSDPVTGLIGYIEGSAFDVTARREAEERLRQLAAVVDSSHEAIISKTPDDVILSWNPGAERLYGYSTHEALGRRFADLVPPARAPSQTDSGESLMARLMAGEHISQEETARLNRHGRRVEVSVSLWPVRDAQGHIQAISSIAHDITDRRALERERERLLAEALARADQDPLTGLLNHRAFHKRLGEECERARREGSTVAVVMLDLDNFKFFNDAYGHLVGDKVLQRLADALTQNTREAAQALGREYTVVRFGGDEFALLLPGLDHSGACALVSRLAEQVAEQGYRPEGTDSAIPLGLSAGIAVWPEEADTRLAAIELADERLRRAKSGADDAQAEQIRTQMGRSLEGFSMLDALVTAVDNKDRYTRRHSEDVMAYSLQIAEGLGLDKDTRHTVAVAALLHDVGKIGVPDRILRKPGKLNDEEFGAVQQHPQMGAIIVAAIPGLEGTLDAVRHHHERWDGGGYPFGLAGEATPLIARLMAVADAFSAMTTDRPYRQGMAQTQALGILEKGAGTQWDPQCVQAFLHTRGKGIPDCYS